MGRTLLYGRLEDEKAFNTVRRLVQYEDYVLRLLYSAGLQVPRPYGIVEITPEREYLVVMEFFDGAREIGEADIDDAIIDQGLLAVRRMWEAGLAHRDIKPANLLVRDGRLLVIDSAFAQVRPSPWRQAVDLANMMLVLALRTDAPRVLARARTYFEDSEIAEAFAATRGLTMPSQLRHMLRAQGRDLHQEFIALLPYRLPTVKIQRWSLRRVTLTIAVLHPRQPPRGEAAVPVADRSLVAGGQPRRVADGAVCAQRVVAALHQRATSGVQLRPAGCNRPRSLFLAERRPRGHACGPGGAVAGLRSAGRARNTQ